jgi:flagellar motor component MotA
MSRSLPPNPSLEQIKKQAKELLAAFAAGDAAGVELVVAHLPRLDGASADQLREAKPSLQEAQHVLAVDYGYANWNWLHAAVEVDFDLLARLTDREIQTLMREVDQKDLVVGLVGASEVVKAAILSNMSERVRQFIQEEMVFLGEVDPAQILDTQRRIIQQLHHMAQQGQVSWPNGETPKPDQKEREARMTQPNFMIDFLRQSLDELSLEQVARMWTEIAESARKAGILSLEQFVQEAAEPSVAEGIQLAVDGTEPDLIEDILRTRMDCVLLPRIITRVRMLIEAVMAIQAGDNPRIILHKLSAFFLTFHEQLGADASPNSEVTVEQLADRLRQQSFAALGNADRAMLLADLGCLARTHGMAALAPLVDATDDALLKRGLELLVGKEDPGRIMEILGEQTTAQVLGAKARYTMCLVGIRMIQAGKKPEDISAAVLEAGQKALEEED